MRINQAIKPYRPSLLYKFAAASTIDVALIMNGTLKCRVETSNRKPSYDVE